MCQKVQYLFVLWLQCCWVLVVLLLLLLGAVGAMAVAR